LAKLSKEQASILATLEELGGKQVKQDDITFEGTKFIIPEQMKPAQALKFLSDWIQNQDEEHMFSRQYKFRWYDGANATYEVLNELYGGTMGMPTYTMFGKQPPRFMDIPVGPNETKQVPHQWVAFPLVEGKIHIGSEQDAELGLVFQLHVQCPRRYKWAVEGLFAAVEDRLNTKSIYRGKAFDGRQEPNFLDLSKVDPEKVIYTDHVQQQLNANIWSLMQHTAKMREWNLPLKRSVLLEGPYGTGKTLAAFLTARIAVESGWTFIYCRPSRDNLNDVLQTAKLYQPSVVFFEDIDVAAEADGNEADRVSRLLDAFDGIAAKSSEIVCILTTNHADKIHKGMIRPGRLDAVIHIGELDRDGIEKLVTSLVPESNLDKDVDFDKVAVAMDGYLPAFVREAVDRASRYAIVRTDGNPDVIGTDDLVQAAEGLRDQLKLMEEAPEHNGAWSIDRGIRQIVENVNERSHVDDWGVPIRVAAQPDVI
jgi:transitional endoplasmic reticulum ATPase